MNAVTQIIPEEKQMQIVSPLTLIDRALTMGATPDALKTLLDLQERWEANEARKLFVAEMAKAKLSFGPILKKTSGYNNRYKYETLVDIQNAVDGPLADHGFFYDWKTEDLADGRVRVTCIVTHEAGHSRSNSLSGHPDDTADAKANMNGHQRMGGAVTYLQRYTLKAALGIAASIDTDANAPRGADHQKIIGPDEVNYFNQLCADSNSSDVKVLSFVGASNTSQMTFEQYRKAISAMQAKINKTKKETENATAQ